MSTSQMIEYTPHNNHPPAADKPIALSPMDLPAEVFQAGLDRRRQNRHALISWLRQALIEGVDFGSIPTRRGPSKPSLWKPGAEKICGMLGVTVHFPTLKDYERSVLNGVALQQVIIRCEIRDAHGAVVADGVGARQLKQDQGDLNKALKMAEKSAMIDATLRLAGLSELFTQDLEDLPPDNIQSREQHGVRDLDLAKTLASTKPGAAVDVVALLKRIEQLGLDKNKVRAWLISATNGAVEQFEQLDADSGQLLSDKLDDWAARINSMDAE